MPLVSLYRLDNANQNQIKFGGNASRRLLGVVNDSRFIDKIQKGTYASRRYRRDDGKFVTASIATIIEIINSGKERKTIPDNEIDLRVRLERLDDDIVGRVQPPDPFITTNTLFYNRWLESNDSLSLAAHWMHEWLHVAGFRHVPLANGKPNRKDIIYKIGSYVVQTGRLQAQDDGFTKDDVSRLGLGYLETWNEHFQMIQDEE